LGVGHHFFLHRIVVVGAETLTECLLVSPRKFMRLGASEATMAPSPVRTSCIASAIDSLWPAEARHAFADLTDETSKIALTR